MQTPFTGQAIYNVHDVARYLHWLKRNKGEELSPIKLQKGLYFLYAFYGAIYDVDAKEMESEGSNNLSTLFDAEFEAWQYGPVIRDVYFRNKDNSYDELSIRASVETIRQNPEAKAFIDEMFEEINSVSDFTLVDKSHEDQAWYKAFKNNQDVIDNDYLIREYVVKVKEDE
ncbi:Panacea domain-containing protein [Marinococcus halophilus]|uniref:Panacea domain-containing protein n=1 Tax=Marinococcus halophilus TaxID=1371 RepID=UPI0015C4365B|nr:type II toxin-antitoxin system antitoxin SocA domain-containing protein [Marinococcus halophilus]